MTAVLLRADLDALSVQEATGVEFSSQVDGAIAFPGCWKRYPAVS